MKTFVTVSSSGNITNVFGEWVSPNIPINAIEISYDDGFMIRQARCFGDYRLVNGALELDTTFISARLFSEAIPAKIAEIDAAYNAAIAVISASYPETERNSWAKQEAEARAWTANNTAATPLLSAIATARGSTLADIAARVITNADAYAVYAGGVIGKRQAKMISIAAATTLTELEAITW